MGPRLKSRGVLFSLPPPVFSPGGTRGSCQTKPGTAGWSIPDKSSEVRAVKRLLTSHFICQTFISLFTVQCTSSIRAMLHTCAWTTFRACSPYFSWPHEQTREKKMMPCLQMRENKHRQGNVFVGVSAVCRRSHRTAPLSASLRLDVYLCLCEYKMLVHHGLTVSASVAHDSAATILPRVESITAPRTGREGETISLTPLPPPSLSLTLSHTLWGSPRRRGASCTSFVTPFGALCLWLPCSGPTWQLTVQTDICSFQPPGEWRKQQPNRPCSLALCPDEVHTVTNNVCRDVNW